MSKYLSEGVIRDKLEENERYLDSCFRQTIEDMNNGNLTDARNQIVQMEEFKHCIHVLQELLRECKDIDTTDTNTNTETQKHKQCKDCEEFVNSNNPPDCKKCSKFSVDEGCTWSKHHSKCVRLGFCKKHEKFVDNETECLDEEE